MKFKNPDYSTEPSFFPEKDQKKKNPIGRTEIAHKSETLGSSLYPLTSIIIFNKYLLWISHTFPPNQQNFVTAPDYFEPKNKVLGGLG